jgi:hypothetical protein
LQLYGFKSLSSSALDYGGYYHEYFLRHRPHLLPHIHRTKINGNKVRRAASRDNEPDFYRMPFLKPTGSPLTTNTTVASQAVTEPCPSTSGNGEAAEVGGRQQISSSPEINTEAKAAEADLQFTNVSLPWATATRGPSRPGIAPIVSPCDTRADVMTPTGIDYFTDSSTTGRSDGVPLNDIFFHSSISVCDGSLEPTPLPPANVWQGGEFHTSLGPLSVAQHPNFEQVNSNYFVFVGSKGRNH